jgi:predicted alpha/beta superfamily hydrolase
MPQQQRNQRYASMAFALAVLIAGGEPRVAAAQVVDRTPAPAEVKISNSRAIDIVSSVNGHRYRINIALPSGPPPAAGYRTLYLLDGTTYFGTAAEAVRSNGNALDVVVVGIGYPESAAFAADSDARWGPPPPVLAKLDPVMRARRRERAYDLTLPATDAELKAFYAPSPAPYSAAQVGGVDDLLKTIEVDVKPRVAAMVKIDRANQTFFGHSLGGLAVLRALFTEPDAFHVFVAASPSIWWNDRSVLAGEPQFEALVTEGKTAPRILITVGAKEQGAPSSRPPSMTAAEYAAMDNRTRMVTNATALAARLKALKGAPGYQVQAAVFDQQAHGISPWPAIGRAVDFAFQQ